MKEKIVKFYARPTKALGMLLVALAFNIVYILSPFEQKIVLWIGGVMIGMSLMGLLVDLVGYNFYEEVKE